MVSRDDAEFDRNSDDFGDVTDSVLDADPYADLPHADLVDDDVPPADDEALPADDYDVAPLPDSGTRPTSKSDVKRPGVQRSPSAPDELFPEYLTDADGVEYEPGTREYVNHRLQAPALTVDANPRAVAGDLAAVLDGRVRVDGDRFVMWGRDGLEIVTEGAVSELLKRMCTTPDRESKAVRAVIPVTTKKITTAIGKQLMAEGYGVWDTISGCFEMPDGTKLTSITEAADSWIGDTTNTNKILADFVTRDSVRISEPFDANPDLIRAGRVVIDLSEDALADGSVKTRPLTRRDLMLKSLNAEFDPEATCPNWDRFLAEVSSKIDRDTGEVIARPHMVRYLRQVMGLMLSGRNFEQKVFCVWGKSGANGKSVFADTLLSLFGTYKAILPRAVIEEGGGGTGPTTDLTVLQGARLAYAKETRKARWDVERLKELRSSEDMVARRLYQDNETWAPTHTLLLTTNNTPRVPAGEQAFWRGIDIIPFDQRWYAESDSADLKAVSIALRDPNLTQKLIAERDGILNDALRGLIDYYANGFQVPDEVREATAEARTMGSAWSDFIVESIDVTEDDQDSVEVRTMWKLWIAFKDANSQHRTLAPTNPQDMLDVFLGEVPAARLTGREPGKRRGVQRFTGVKLSEDAENLLKATGGDKSNVIPMNGGVK